MSELVYSSVTSITQWIVHRLGYPIVTVELDQSQLTYAVNEAVEKHSAIITDWAIENEIAEIFGLSSYQEFTRKWVSHDIDFARTFTDAYSQQAGVGGKLPFLRSYFVLSGGVQFYTIPSGRVVSELFWQDSPALVSYDVNYLFNEDYWIANEFGWALYGYNMSYLTPMYYHIQLSQNIEQRNRMRRGSKTYRITKDISGNNEVFLTPEPLDTEVGNRIWYFYIDEALYNEKYSGVTSGLYVTDPATVNYREIAYSAFNSSSQRWVKDAALAISKQILGRIRSKFGTIPIPDAEVTLDGASLLEEGKTELETLKEQLLVRLDKLKYSKILEQEAIDAQNVNKSLSYHPNKIYIG